MRRRLPIDQNLRLMGAFQMMEFFNWLFSTRNGMLTLFGIGILFFLILAYLLERRTKKMYYNHDKPATDDDDSDSGFFGGLFNFGNDDEDEEDEDDDDGENLSDMIKSLRSELDDWDPDEDDKK